MERGLGVPLWWQDSVARNLCKKDAVRGGVLDGSIVLRGESSKVVRMADLNLDYCHPSLP